MNVLICLRLVLFSGSGPGQGSGGDQSLQLQQSLAALLTSLLLKLKTCSRFTIYGLNRMIVEPMDCARISHRLVVDVCEL